MAKKDKKDLTPAQSHEYMQELLDLQKEEADLKCKMDKAAEVHKSAKANHDAKRDEMMKMLEGLNQELPLFDKPNDAPWPFPLTEDVHEATLANVAADPVVLSLSIGLVKQVRTELQAFTLKEIETAIGGSVKLNSAEQDKAKLKLADKLGGSNTWKLLRAIHSFTGNRKKKAAPKEAKKPKAKKADPVPVSEVPKQE